MAGPPRVFVLLADWGNTIAGFLLMGAFLWGALIYSVGMKSLVAPEGGPNEFALKWLQFFFCSEGVFYAFAELFMIGIMANTPPEFGGGTVGCMQFAILMAGGIFFSFSGLVIPPCITNVTYLFNTNSCNLSNPPTPYVWNAVAHYGITCFMIGTAIGFKGVLAAPKDKFISPFWGCAMYFLGAWTIGIFKFWGPVLFGGLNEFDLTAPAITWTLPWWFALVGAFFLFLGAIIFGIMNGSFGKIGSNSAPQPQPNPDMEKRAKSSAEHHGAICCTV